METHQVIVTIWALPIIAWHAGWAIWYVAFSPPDCEYADDRKLSNILFFWPLSVPVIALFAILGGIVILCEQIREKRIVRSEERMKPE